MKNLLFFYKYSSLKAYSENFLSISILLLNSIYLALKVEEKDDQTQYEVSKQLQKKETFNNYKHLNQDGYLQKELDFISYLGYELDIPNIYRGLESLIGIMITKNKQIDGTIKVELQEKLLKLSHYVFYDYLVFKYDAGILALALFQYVIQENSHGKPLINKLKYPERTRIFVTNNIQTIEKAKSELKQIINNYQHNDQKINTQRSSKYREFEIEFKKREQFLQQQAHPKKNGFQIPSNKKKDMAHRKNSNPEINDIVKKKVKPNN
ncbi:hypothetical protein PPERSA_06746 [Pseudocohnilembus persalinus]|uniref:Cyclin-like protein n=1 Tax=Pseudocohnilembus persalinus TaxID=266149 RepID=A0A0V0QT79_PSEPJ|nr:hypothetical protein PPERSA_06746 [Pseudocohnilembus persalinus]|eukprot:KRX05112.1 hypothetical protein PPERSA_06746 [Pseudocohnilembus persalinus]